MPAKQYRVYLSEEEREHLQHLVNTGSNKARRITRARILLLADESEKAGKKDRKILKILYILSSKI